MKNYQIITLILTTFILSSCGNTDDNELTQKNLGDKINSFLEQNQSNTAPGISIVVKHEGVIVYEQNKGLARTTDSHVIDTDTQFRIGSITKPFTAIAIMKLVEENRISLDEKLVDYIPSLPSNLAEITIEHLLTHRSGLIDYIDENEDLRILDNIPTSEILTFIEGSGLENLLFEPGSQGDYSNTGYVFLALIIEKVSGVSFPEYLQIEIFEPVQMSNSFVISEYEHLGDNGNNYALSFGTNLKVLGFNSLIYGAGGIASTTKDLIRFTDALLNYEIITKPTLDMMTKTKGPLPGLGDYGLGWLTGTGNYWHTGKYSDADDFWHSGGNDGYRSVLSINPILDLQVVILTNNGDTSQTMMYNILEITRNYIKQNKTSGTQNNGI